MTAYLSEMQPLAIKLSLFFAMSGFFANVSLNAWDRARVYARRERNNLLYNYYDYNFVRCVGAGSFCLTLILLIEAYKCFDYLSTVTL